MPFIWTVRGGRDGGAKYLQLFKGGIFYPLKEELAAEMLARSSAKEANQPEEVPEFASAKEIKVHEIEGEGPELIMHLSRGGSGITYAIRLFGGGESFAISPNFAYGVKYTNRLELVEVGRKSTKKEPGKAMVYRLSPMQPSCVSGEKGRICSYML
jgi:hypothetical protein